MLIPNLDTTTVLFFGAIMGLWLFGVLWFAGSNAAAGAGLRQWRTSIALYAVAWVLVWLSASTDLQVFFYLSNPCYFLSAFLALEGNARFVGRERERWQTWLPVVIVTVATLYFSWVQPDRVARLIVATGAFYYVLGVSIWVLRSARSNTALRRTIDWLIFWYAAYLGWLTLRLGLVLFAESGWPASAHDKLSALNYILTTVGYMGFAFGYVMLTYARVQERSIRSYRELTDLKRSIDAHATFAVLDAEGTILEVNDKFCALTQYDRAELVGHNHLVTDSGIHPPSLFRTMLAEVASGRPWHGEVCHRARDGSLFWVSCTVVPIASESGPADRFMEFWADVTKRKQAEDRSLELARQLSQAQKAEITGTVAGGIAHDFNNLLTAISGFVELARRGLPENSEAAAFLHEAQKTSLRATDLVQRLLVFARRGPAKEKTLVDVAELLDESAGLLRASLRSSIDLRISAARHAGLVRGDPGQLQQVLLNLVINAGHAMMGRPGTIAVTLTAHPGPGDDHLIVLQVRDDGCGMDEGTRARIFEPFFTTKPPGEGTGLGLAVVYSIVSDHGGSIAVDSQPGVGTTFTIHLPVEQQGPAPARSAPSRHPFSPAQPLGQRLLVVDDETIVLEVTAQFLRGQGFTVDDFASSREALAAYQQAPAGHYAGAVLDLTMPELDGLSLLAALRDREPGLKAVLTSGDPGRYAGHGLVPDAATLLVPKPFTAAEILGAVNRTLGLEASPNPAPALRT